MLRMTKVGVAGLALAVLLCWVPGSQAAIYGGSATDPSGDLGLDVGDGLPSPLVDFTGVSVKYDDVSGRVDVSYTFNRTPANYQNINAGVGLGTILPNGYCSTPQLHSLGWHLLDGDSAGQAAIYADGQTSGGNVWGSVWNFGFDEATWQSTSSYNWSGSTWTFATANAQLVGKHYNCARAAHYVSGGGAGGVGIDYLNADVFALAPVTPAAPTAKWQNPKDGQTVSGTLSESSGGAQQVRRRDRRPGRSHRELRGRQAQRHPGLLAVGLRVEHAQLRQRRPPAHGQGLRRGKQRDRRRHHPGDREQPQSAHWSTLLRRRPPSRPRRPRRAGSRANQRCDSPAKRRARP